MPSWYCFLLLINWLIYVLLTKLPSRSQCVLEALFWWSWKRFHQNINTIWPIWIGKLGVCGEVVGIDEKPFTSSLVFILDFWSLAVWFAIVELTLVLGFGLLQIQHLQLFLLWRSPSASPLYFTLDLSSWLTLNICDIDSLPTISTWSITLLVFVTFFMLVAQLAPRINFLLNIYLLGGQGAACSCSTVGAAQDSLVCDGIIQRFHLSEALISFLSLDWPICLLIERFHNHVLLILLICFIDVIQITVVLITFVAASQLSFRGSTLVLHFNVTLISSLASCAYCSSASSGQTLQCLASLFCCMLLSGGLKCLWQLRWLLASRALLGRLRVVLGQLLLFLVGGHLGLLPCLTPCCLALVGLRLRAWRILTCAFQTEATRRRRDGPAGRPHGPGRLPRSASFSFFGGSSLLLHRSTGCLSLPRRTLVLLAGPSALALFLWYVNDIWIFQTLWLDFFSRIVNTGHLASIIETMRWNVNLHPQENEFPKTIPTFLAWPQKQQLTLFSWIS